MKKFAVALLGMLVCQAALYAQDTTKYWRTGGNVGLNFSQVGLSNWAAGGQSTISIIGLLGSAADYNKGRIAWLNSIDLGYGMTKQGESPLRKSDDKIILTSKFGVAALPALEDEDERDPRSLAHVAGEGSPVSYTALLDIRTQFTVGRDFDITDSVTGSSPVTSAFMSPGYVTLALGAEFRPIDFFSVLFSPIAGRFTFVLDKELSDAGAFGVDPGTTIRSELGMLLNALLRKEIMDNVTLQSRLNLFASYKRLHSIAVTWESALRMKVNDYINVALTADVIYDERIDITRDDGSIGPSTQIRNTLALGIGYGF